MQTETLAWFVVAFVAGAAVSWLVAHGRSARDRGIAQERLAARDREVLTLQEVAAKQEFALREKESECAAVGKENAGLKAQVDAAKEATRQRLEDEQMLKNAFSSLAADALHTNNRLFVDLAKEKLGEQQKEATSKLTEKETAIGNLLKPMRKSLEELSTQSHELEVKREGAYQGVLAEIQNIQRSHTDLRRETTQLVQALRAPKARGNWGELQLKKCVEFAGMVQYASFDVERFVRGEDAGYRPDLVVKMPNGRTIIVDAKTPLDAFLDASTEEDEVVRTAKLVAHAARVREHLKELSSKGYWRQFIDSPDFVVCFLPSEVLFSAALEQDPSLIEYSASSGVLLATPTTLIALLKAVAFGWQQSEIAKNADAIRDAALAVYGKLAGIYDDFIDLGNRLKAAGGCYDDIVTKIDGRGGVFSIARKLRELGIGEKDLEASKKGKIKAIGLTLKPMEAEDWQPLLSLAAEAEDNAQ
jgi:DNA recombination protein RmuC